MRAGPGVPRQAGACMLGFPSFAGRAGVGETWDSEAPSPGRREAPVFRSKRRFKLVHRAEPKTRDELDWVKAMIYRPVFRSKRSLARAGADALYRLSPTTCHVDHD